jgi:hypothetical protein
MASKIGKKEWTALFIVMGIIDFIQFAIIELILVWFFGLGAAINEVLDPIVGASFAGYLLLRRVSPVTYWKSYASIIGMAGLEEITGGVAQLWILDVWYIKKNVQQIEGAVDDQKQAQTMRADANRQPTNAGGRREPPARIPTSNRIQPLNTDGIRRVTIDTDETLAA